jgi:hypothetical protein
MFFYFLRNLLDRFFERRFLFHRFVGFTHLQLHLWKSTISGIVNHIFMLFDVTRNDVSYYTTLVCSFQRSFVFVALTIILLRQLR